MSAFPSALPTSRVPDPRSAPPLRWGILAPGGIASQFTEALKKHTAQQVIAVGSRSLERAEAFAQRLGIEAAYGTYAALVDDPDVDVVYVASPHSEHHAHALTAIAAGKHVLVEKAFTRNSAEAAEVIAAAEAAGVMVMEAMWTRFLPQTDVIRQLLADGVLGDVSTVIADHGQYFADLAPTHRLLDPALAGGALLDLGIYPVSFASFAMGTPESITASGSLTKTGVDAQVSVILETGAAQAVLNTTLLAETPTTATISGSCARVEIGGPFYEPQPLTLTEARTGQSLKREVDPISGHDGLCFEATEFARCVAAGEIHSPLLLPAETLAIMGTLDTIRRQIGVAYPGE
ncbi:MAG: Gfo/Idh/MocA family oxidoreductase [Nakamurella sp.]